MGECDETCAQDLEKDEEFFDRLILCVAAGELGVFFYSFCERADEVESAGELLLVGFIVVGEVGALEVF